MNTTKTLVFCLALVGALATKERKPDPRSVYNRIVGGTDATPGEFPSIAALSSSPFHTSFCGGTIIADRWILTAAHCAGGPVYVTLGNHEFGQADTNQETIEGWNWIVHPDYNDNTVENDIALIYLKRAASAVHTRAIPVYNVTDGESLMEAGDDVVVAGWGALEEGGNAPDVLQKVTVPLVSSAYCTEAYGSGYVEESMICAGTDEGGKDSCQGDSGGPLYSGEAGFEGVQVGVVSWGHGCARAGIPGVYTRLNNYKAWVDSVMALTPCAEHTCENGAVVMGDPTNSCQYSCDCVVDTPENIADGYCDQGSENTAVCGWDGGDCCEDTCQPGLAFSCGSGGYVCTASWVDSGAGATPTPTPDPDDSDSDAANTVVYGFALVLAFLAALLH